MGFFKRSKVIEGKVKPEMVPVGGLFDGIVGFDNLAPGLGTALVPALRATALRVISNPKVHSITGTFIAFEAETDKQLYAVCMSMPRGCATSDGESAAAREHGIQHQIDLLESVEASVKSQLVGLRKELEGLVDFKVSSSTDK